MRDEEEILAMLAKKAQAEPAVRALCLNGSRVNPNSSPDVMQDFDVVYVVDDLKPFIQQREWLKEFGDMLIMQTPDEMNGGSGRKHRFAFLMLFTGGNRIDLTLLLRSEVPLYMEEDSLIVVLLDKDALFPALELPSERSHYLQPPDFAAFHDCCNEFWWLSTYVAKGAWRSEILYAMDHVGLMREMLLKMTAWHTAAPHHFMINMGKSYKYLPFYLDHDIWQHLQSAFPKPDVASIWRALFRMGDLFLELTVKTAETLGIAYEVEEPKNVYRYLEDLYANSQKPDR